jgi:DNA-directed RNA polymerase subunit beta'
MRTTVGQLLVNDALPEEFRDYTRVLTKGDTDKLLAAVAKTRPDDYRDISHKLVQLGRNAAFEEGTTLRLGDLRAPVDKAELLDHITQQEDRITADKTMTPADKQEARETVYSEVNDALKKMTMDASLASENPFALQVKSKARGNPDQLAAMLTTPGVYQDAKDNIIPVFIRHSYAEGLQPHEYWAATYGARKGVISSKFATRQAGALGKLYGMAVMDSVVTQDDCESPYGIPVKADDNDNLGSVLSRPVAGFTAGTVIDKHVMAALQSKKIDQIVVRSPITCTLSKGVCKHCVGLREGGEFPPIGYHIGLNAASAMAEQIAQASLNVKHSGKKAKGQTTYSGFNVIKNLSTVPQTFPDRATVAERDGKITKVAEAPQGGYHVYIDDEEHYVPAGMDLHIKEGDTVEAGDQLSDGIVNPSDVVRLKGLGEGRRYFAERLTQAFRETNFGVNRRNAEVLARSIVNHIQVDDDGAAGEHLPGDVVTYGSWAYGYRPRKDAKRLTPKAALGQYLEEPAMHYTVGTRVTKNMANMLQQQGTQDILTHTAPVGVSPVMMSVVKTPEYTDDWMARLSSTYLKTRLLEDVHAGAKSNVHGIHPIPGIAKGTEFGQQKGKTFTY